MYLFSDIAHNPFYVVRNLKLLDTDKLAKWFPTWQSSKETMKEDPQIILTPETYFVLFMRKH
jgi:hypothetical protein